MNRLVGVTAIALTLLAGCTSMPGGGPGHQAHHGGSAAMAAGSTSEYDQQMKTMQDMHQKMVAAKTPEERAALMRDHMRTMQDGMAMMGRTRGGMPMDADTMTRRMNMMEMMMQMMMDRPGMMTPPAR